jgi:ATP-dependent Clp protease ATP-binding subunit ClpA
LNAQAIQRIVEKQLDRVRETAAVRGVQLEFDNSLRQYLFDHSYVPEYGARQLHRIIRTIESTLAQAILDGSPRSTLTLFWNPTTQHVEYR